MQINSDGEKWRNVFLIRVDITFGFPFKVVCVLNRNPVAGYFSKFEIHAELDLAGTGFGYRLPKS